MTPTSDRDAGNRALNLGLHPWPGPRKGSLPARLMENSAATSPSPSVVPPKRENLWVNILCNAVFPALVLTTLSKEHRLGPMWALLLAISLPLGYGIYDLLRREMRNALSVLGVVSTALTGGLGLFKLSGFWFAVKEAAVPLVLGIAVPLTLKTRQPLVKVLVCNDQVLNMPRVEAALDAAGRRPDFDRLLRSVSWIIAGSFALSAVLNFVLALWILKSPPGTTAFTEELGRLTALSYPVISIPTMVVMVIGMWKLITGIERLTGLGGDDIFHSKPKKS